MTGRAVAPAAGQRALVVEVVKAVRHDSGQQHLILDLAMPGLDEVWQVEVIADVHVILPNGGDGLDGATSMVLEAIPRVIDRRAA